MPTIIYDATGGATESEMDNIETDAKTWRNGAEKVLSNIDKRYDVEAVQIRIEWTVADGEVDATVSALDSAISSFGAVLPPASDAAVVEYE